jgi:hypothetical protein
MQPPTWKLAELHQRFGRFEGEQKLTQLSAIAAATPLALRSYTLNLKDRDLHLGGRLDQISIRRRDWDSPALRKFQV